MKSLLLFLLLFISLVAKSNDACYNIGLITADNSKKNLKFLNLQNYPNDCRIIKSGNYITTRCGCFDSYKNAKSRLKELKQDYKKAKITTTYKDRFDNKITKITKQQDIPKKDPSRDDGELRRILQIFLYNSDLKNAYKIAKIGYEKNKNSFYWNEKMYEVCKWDAKFKESIIHLRKMYELTKDTKYVDTLISDGSSHYQYEITKPLVLQKVKENPSEKNLNNLTYIYSLSGSPEELIPIFESLPKSTKGLVARSLIVSLDIGDLDAAKKYIKILENKKPYTINNTILIARYYYTKREINKAYQTLQLADETTASSNKELTMYYKFKSDMGWYLQKSLVAAIASTKLMQLNKARLIDYERILFVYHKQNPYLVLKAVKKVLLKYKKSYFFYSFVGDLFEKKYYDDLEKLFDFIETNKLRLINEANYWLVKARYYALIQDQQLQINALQKARSLSPNNNRIKIEILWAYMSSNNAVEVKKILLDLDKDNIDSNYYLNIASAYYYLHDINRSFYYMQKLRRLNTKDVNNFDFKFLYAYLLQIQNKEYQFITAMKKINKELLQVASNNMIWHIRYLNSGIYIWHPDKFEKQLSLSKQYLDKKNYDEISYSWAMRHQAEEKSHAIYLQMHKPELWVGFSNALVFQEHSNIEDYIRLYLQSLSLGDTIGAARDDGQIALSQTLTFEGFLHNDDSQNLYIRHMNLSKERADLFEIKTAYYQRDPLLQEYVRLKNETYLQMGTSLLTELAYYSNSSTDTSKLNNSVSSTTKVKVGLKKLYNRGVFTAKIGYHSTMKNYVSYEAKVEHKVSTDLKLDIGLSKNIDALESTQLLVGGKKDMVSSDISWNFLDSTYLNILHEINSYKSQDDVNLGKGTYSRLNLYHQLRQGYPDIRIGTFIDNGSYSETSGSRGCIDKLQTQSYKVLPENFQSIGVSLEYGMVNSRIYTRVWRPYFEISPYYNDYTDDFTYTLHAGYGGKVWHQDHLSIGATYSESVNGIDGSIFELYLNYQFMYYHP